MNTRIALSVLILLAGCDASSDKTAEQIQAEVAASQEQFALERARIERESAAREAQLATQRSFVSVEFVSVDPRRLEVLLHNRTDKPIDNLAGGLEVLDADGNPVTGIALTNWVPGDIYLPLGGSAIAVKTLALENPETRNRIVAEASGFQYQYTVHRIQFVGESEISFLDQVFAGQGQQELRTPTKPPEPANPNQASPEPCAANQVSIETVEQYYPGPQCAHMERNIDSERFKQEYIQLCQRESKAESPPVSAARVQLSSCRKGPGGQGIVYTKRICC
jgi:hypothetical protein